MQTKELTVCNIGLFGDEPKHFWMGELSGVLEKFPELEYAHKQEFYMLLFVEQAQGELIIDNQKIRLDEAKVIIIKPRCVSSIDINRQAKGKLICFTEDFFSIRYNNNILHEFAFLQTGAKPYIRLSDEQRRHWEVLIKLLLEEFQLQKEGAKKVLRSYLNIIIYDLERIYRPFPLEKVRNIKQEKIHQFEALIENNYTTKKLPSGYADILNISPNYLNKICREETGQTAGDLIRRRITLEAQRLLHHTNLSVNEIANKLGFENLSYFITFFKKQTGDTPEQFRKQNN